ncbi:MAG TPA: hypothetical protein VFF15_08590 [Flavobacteriaceae bacterium]|nr:hypothetical protein [Flavobacteriaceae bacterium]
MEFVLPSKEYAPVLSKDKNATMSRGILNSSYKNAASKCVHEQAVVFTAKSRAKLSRFLDATPTVDALVKIIIFTTVLLWVV